MRKPTLLAIIVILILGVTSAIWWHSSNNDRGPNIGLITFVDHPVLNEIIDSFKKEMVSLGYRNGENSTLYFANAQGNIAEIETLARTMLRNNLTVLVPVSTPVSRVVFNVAPEKQTIVYSFVTNPDDLEPALSEKRGTGVSDRINYKKSVQLIKDIYPDINTIGMLYNPTERNSEVALKEIRELAPQLGLSLMVETISNAGEIREACRRLIPKVDLMFIGPDNTVVGNATIVISTALEANKPVIAVDSGSVESGALAAYSVEYKAVGRETARLVDRLIKNPGSVVERVIPVYNDNLILNFCTAEKLGVKFPDSLLGKANQVYKCGDEK